MIRVIKRDAIQQKTAPVKQETRKPANFWVLESRKNIAAQKQAETKNSLT